MPNMIALAKHRTPKEIARALKKKTGFGCERTLRKWRAQRIGPPFVKLGRAVLYPDDGFEAWLLSQVQQPVRSRRAAS
jgi:hypothetical protein